MSFIDRLARKLFSNEKEKPQSEAFHRQELKRPYDEIAAYNEWYKSQDRNIILSLILHQYDQSKDENEDQANFRFLHAGHSNGFMLRAPQGPEPVVFQHLFDYFRDRLKEINYTLYTSDKRDFVKGEQVETIERHYLKPSWRVLNAPEREGKMNQLYGNITIEFYKQNDLPTHMKFLCTHYVDHKFEEALPFESLIEFLTEKA